MNAPHRPTPPAPPHPPPPSIVPALVAWLTHIETWKRTAIALVLGFSSLLAILVYRDPDRLFAILDAAVRPRPTQARYMSLLYSDVYRQLWSLQRSLGETGMIGVIAWRVDLIANRQHYIASAAEPAYAEQIRSLEQARWSIDVPLFGTNPHINHLLGLVMAGRFACGDATNVWDVLSRFPLAEVCVIGVPPDEGGGLSGFIGGGWRFPIADAQRSRVEAAFRATSTALVWKGRSW